MAIDDAIAQAEALRARLKAEKDGKPAPAPGAVAPEMDPVTQAERIREAGAAGTLPTQARLAGEAEPPAQDAQSRLGRMFGLDNAVTNILRYVGPYIGAPETYNPVDAALHGATFGASDPIRGYQRDIITGQPWGTGAGEVKTARDEFAAQHPVENITGNIAGGVATGRALPIPGVAAANRAIAQIPSSLGRVVANLGLGGVVGGGVGGVSGAIDEAPLGPAAALEGAKHGAMWGAGLGTILPGAITAGTAGLRGLQHFFGPQTRAAQEGSAGRTMLDMAKDPAAVQDVATLQGPPPPPVPPVPPPPPGSGWQTGPRNLTPRQQLEQRQTANESMTDPNAGVILPGQEPGMPARPTIGQITDDPGIQDLENRLVAGLMKKDPKDWTPAEKDLATKVHLQSQARTAAFEGQVDPTADPYAVKTPLVAAQRNLEATQEAQTTAAQQRSEALTGAQEADLLARQQRLEAEQLRLGRPLTAEERGDMIRGEQAAGKATSKEGGVALNTQLEASGAVTDQSSTAAAAKAIQARMLKNDKPMEGEELRLFDRAQMQGKAMPLAETLSLRSQITDEVRRVQRDPDADQRSLPRLNALRQKLDETLEPHVAGMDDTTSALYRARQDYWKQHAQTFKNQTAGDILQSGPNVGDYRMLPERVATRILENNSSAEAHLAAGGTQDSLRGALIDDLYRYAKGKPLTDEMLTSWRGNRQGALRAAPGLSDEVRNVGQAQKQIDDLVRTQRAEQVAQGGEMTALAKAQKAERDAFEDGAIGRVIGGDPAKQIAGILVSRDAVPDMMRLKSLVAGDAPAEAGMKRAVIDYMSNRFIDPQSGQINPAAFRRFLNDKAGAIETAVGADGMKVLRLIETDLQRSKPGSPVMAGANKGGTPSSYASLFRAVLEGSRGPGADAAIAPTIAAGSGKAGVGSTVAAFATLGGTKIVQMLRARGIEGPNEILAEAVQNPAFGRAIMMKATPDNMPLAERALQAALTTGRQGTAAGYDYGQAEQRTRQRARQRLLEPVP